MADGHRADGRSHDRFDGELGSGGGFLIGLVAGTIFGAGLGMLLAPKSGYEMRARIARQAGNLADVASDGYKRATDVAGDWADKGRDWYGKARHTVSNVAKETERQ